MFGMEAAEENAPIQVHGFELQALLDGSGHLDQFIDLIRSENEDLIFNFDRDLINGCLDDDRYLSSNQPAGIAGFNNVRKEKEEETVREGEDEENSSVTSTPTFLTMIKKKKKTAGDVDRSRTLICERKRRGRMKQKLYALRSLVPNITKMDKNSIVGDAVLYVKQLQMQAKKLKSEIASLEASTTSASKSENPNNIIPVLSTNCLVPKKIIQMDVFQVQERGFYLRLVSNREESVAAALYAVLESLTGFNVESSNLFSASEDFVLTATLKVKDCEQAVNLQNLKLLVTRALLNQGFEI